MNRARIALMVTLAAACLGVAACAWAYRGWSAARDRTARDDGPPVAPPAGAAPATDQDRIAAARRRLPPAGSPEALQAQRQVVELLERQGFDIAEVVPRAPDDALRRRLPAVAGWPGVAMEVRGRIRFPDLAAVLARLPELPATVVPLDLEISRDGEARQPAAAAGALQVRMLIVL